jgi:hypothetical protein
MEGRDTMHTARIRGLFAGALLALAIGPASAGDAIQWQTSFKTALEKAKAGNKLVMADFYTDW